MQVQSMFPGQGKNIQTIGLAAVIGAAVLFALGLILMLTGGGLLMGHQLPLIFITVAAIDMCFIAALSSLEAPAAEKNRLRTLSIIGALVVVIAITLLATAFRPGVFEIVLMFVTLGGAPGLYKLGEIMGARLKSAGKPAARGTPASSTPASDTAETATSAREAPESGEGSEPAA